MLILKLWSECVTGFCTGLNNRVIIQTADNIARDIKKGICDGFKRGIKGIFWI